MKKIFLLLIIISFSSITFAQRGIKAEEAKDYVGDTVKVCVNIVDTNFDEASKGSPTYLYTSQSNVNTGLHFLIWGERRKYFDYKPEKDLKHRDVCITGKIELLKEKLVIIIEKQNQVDLK